MATLLQCKNSGCKQVWPTPQVTPGKAVISMGHCPKCGSDAKTVGNC